MLRLFSPAAFLASFRSYCAPRGRQPWRSEEYLVLKDQRLVGGQHAMINPQHHMWGVNATDWTKFEQVGLKDLGDIIKSASRSEFEDALLDSLRMYSRATLEDDMAGKLTYLIVAMESFLLRNANEPLQDNLGRRLAWAVGQNLAIRKQIVAHVRQIYDIRSGFFHHGKSVDDAQALETFMGLLWQLFHNAVRDARKRFVKRDEYLGWLDDQCLT
jgi:hypothetical protein